ncbi:MAG: hypothetical protein ABWZ66_10275 [Pyrinomonadaceae bacterium]
MFKEASQSELHAMREHIKEHPGENPAIEKLMAKKTYVSIIFAQSLFNS